MSLCSVGCLARQEGRVGGESAAFQSGSGRSSASDFTFLPKERPFTPHSYCLQSESDDDSDSDDDDSGDDDSSESEATPEPPKKQKGGDKHKSKKAKH